MTAAPVRIAVVGLGHIARGRHVPVIAASEEFELVATVSPQDSGLAGIAHFDDLESLLRDGPTIDAVALCTPPQVRYGIAHRALRDGIHVLLEKPPGTTVGDVDSLAACADRTGASLFTAWHSRFAAGVPAARNWLASRNPRKVEIVWHEDVLTWHPGQAWIWEAGGMGVFDPGINALSILTDILPSPIRFESGMVERPGNRAAPIAAELRFLGDGGIPIDISLDWRKAGEPRWDIRIETDDGECLLSRGGAELTTPTLAFQDEDREYPALYAHFADLVRRKVSDVDCRPLQLVDYALRGARQTTGRPFSDDQLDDVEGPA